MRILTQLGCEERQRQAVESEISVPISHPSPLETEQEPELGIRLPKQKHPSGLKNFVKRNNETQETNMLGEQGVFIVG